MGPAWRLEVGPWVVKRSDVYELMALQAMQRRVLEQLFAAPDNEPARLELREILGQMLRLLD
jgi:hypothetical protein